MEELRQTQRRFQEANGKGNRDEQRALEAELRAMEQQIRGREGELQASKTQLEAMAAGMRAQQEQRAQQVRQAGRSRIRRNLRR